MRFCQVLTELGFMVSELVFYAKDSLVFSSPFYSSRLPIVRFSFAYQLSRAEVIYVVHKLAR